MLQANSLMAFAMIRLHRAPSTYPFPEAIFQLAVVSFQYVSVFSDT